MLRFEKPSLEQIVELMQRYLSRLGVSKKLLAQKAKELLNMSRGSVYFTALLWSGISPIDYKRLRSCTDSAQIHFSESGRPEVIWLDAVPDKKSICWTHDFVVSTIVHWQCIGFTPSISAWASEASKNLFGMF